MSTALETQIANLQRDDRERGRPDEADIVEYIASLGSEPEAEIAAPDEKSALRIEGNSVPSPSLPHEPGAQTGRPLRKGLREPQPSTTSDRIPGRRRGRVAEETYESPPGVQGANVGYWQAGGVTRAGAKRSKRP